MPSPYTIEVQKGYYPIVYVRGYAMTRSEKEDTFNDAYYGFSATSVEKRQATPDDNYLVADVFEGQLIRFMKNKDYGYADASNRGLIEFHSNPSRSIWVSRFYDLDYINDKIRSIEDHAMELAHLIINVIPDRLIKCGMDEASVKKDYKVILIAHSMGGLVCRTLLQNILQNLPQKIAGQSVLDVAKMNANELIHRFVTIGTPHKGIELGNLPDVIENSVVSAFNPFDANIFKERRMREYLKLEGSHDVHSLNGSFPIKRCLCIIGSDYSSYIAAKYLTGSFSDGLVKQNNAYMVDGPKSPGGYPEENTAYYANVHRAHSGYRGIVNSYETYENIQRFLFGDMQVRIALAQVTLNTPQKEGVSFYYDFEFALSIRGTGVYLHRREQDPCENAFRFNGGSVPNNILLHTGFLNSKLRLTNDPYSYFLLKFRILEYRVEKGFLWDHKYPSRQIYSESLEVRIGNLDLEKGTYPTDYRWHSDIDAQNGWQALPASDGNGVFTLPLRAANSVSGNIEIKALEWKHS